MASYKIKKGDTLSAIAKANGTTVAAIAKANGIKNKNLIVTGKSLTIPGKANATSTKTPSARQTGSTTKTSSKASGPSAVTGKQANVTTKSTTTTKAKTSSNKVTVTGRDGKKVTADYGTKNIVLPKVPAGAVTTRVGAVEAGKTAKFNYGSKSVNVTSAAKPARKPTAAEIALGKKRSGGK